MLWPSKVFIPVVISLQILRIAGQLSNYTTSAEDILDYYEPAYNLGNITRIVGGKAVGIRVVPWQIALYNRGTFICGGSIISADWVLTAAHCVESGKNFAVTAGSSYAARRGQFRFADLVIVHSRYKEDPDNFDIALIKVRSPFHWNPYVRPVKLAKPNRKIPHRYFISGWGVIRENGYNRSPVLKGATVRNVNLRECQKKYRGKGQITRYMICAASPGKDACQGDSGGPLVNRNTQYGVVSFGFGCARADYPGVYTNVRREYTWIRKVIQRWGGQLPK